MRFSDVAVIVVSDCARRRRGLSVCLRGEGVSGASGIGFVRFKTWQVFGDSLLMQFVPNIACIAQMGVQLTSGNGGGNAFCF